MRKVEKNVHQEEDNSISNSNDIFCQSNVEWNGLYKNESSFKKFVHSSSNKHPAKMAFRLTEKILQHLEEKNLIDNNTIIVDFMAGSGRTGIISAIRGYKSILVELEPNFIEMQKKSIRELERQVGSARIKIKIFHGDSRYLTSLLRDHTAQDKVGIISPPYEDAEIPVSIPSGTVDEQRSERQELRSKGEWEGYNRSDTRNIGNLKEKEYEDAMTEVYSEAKKTGISPLVVVTKNPTRKGKLVDVATITANALERAGYEVFDYHRARLFDVSRTQTSKLFPQSQEKTQGRISFFKRLSMKKGSVAAEWEDIMFAKKI
jgi:DNA modification methylase